MPLARSADLSVGISGDSSGLERALKSAESATASAERALGQYDSSLRRLEGSVGRAQKQLDDDMAAALRRQHDALDKTGRGFVLFGAAVAGGLALAGREAMRWETAWTGVTKTVDGSESEMAALEDQLRSLARTLPVSHEQIAAVAEAAGQLGVQRENIAGFTKVMIDLGETTNLSADEAATSIAQMMNVMQTAPDDVGRLGAALVALGNDGASTEQDIVQMAQRIAGAGHQVGMTEADVLSVANALASAGIAAEAGGSAISRTMIEIAQAVDEGGDKLDAFAEVAGVSGERFARLWGQDAAAALDLFVRGLGNVKQQGGSTFGVLEDLEITEIRQRDALLRLAGAGDLLTQSLKTGNQAWEDNTALLIEANKRYETAESRARVAMNQIRDAAIDIGGVVLPIFADLVEFIGNIVSAFGDLPGPVKTAVTILATLTAAVALVGGAAMMAIPKIAAFNTAVASLNAGALKTAGVRVSAMASAMAGPWGLALAGGITALGLFAAKQGESAREIEAFTAALDQQTGALTESNRQMLFDDLVDEGAFDDLKNVKEELDGLAESSEKYAEVREKLGNISNADLFAAAAGDPQKLRQVTEQLNAARDAMSELFDGKAAGAQQVLSPLGRLISALDGTNGKIAESRDKLDLQRSAGVKAAEATDKFAGATRKGGDAAGEMAEEVESLTDALDRLNRNTLNVREAQRGYEAALDDARKSLKENGRTLDENTAAGRSNAEALDAIADRTMGVVEALEENNASARSMKQAMQDGREELYNTARQFGMTEQQARAYVDRVLSIPKSLKTQVHAETAEAQRKIGLLKQTIQGLKGRTITIYENHVVTTSRSGSTGRIPEGLGNADGGWIRGPGGPRDDKIPRWLSNGEFVTNARSASKFGPLLEWINAHGMADGGFVGGSPDRIDAPFIMQMLSAAVPVPNLREYHRALREEAQALRRVRRERADLNRENQQARKAARTLAEAERALSRHDDLGTIRSNRRETVKELEQTQRDLERMENRDRKKLDKAEKRDLDREIAKAQREATRMRKRIESLTAEEKVVERLAAQRKRADENATRQAKQAEQAERSLEKAKDAHAKATDRVRDAVDAYSRAQQAAIDRANATAQAARSGASVFGGDFVDPGFVSDRFAALSRRLGRFISLRRRLVKAGVHPFLLEQIDEEGPTEAAITFAQELLNSPEMFARLNRQARQVTRQSQVLGADTAAVHGPRGTGGGAGSRTYSTVIYQTINSPATDAKAVGDSAADRLLRKLGR